MQKRGFTAIRPIIVVSAAALTTAAAAVMPIALTKKRVGKAKRYFEQYFSAIQAVDDIISYLNAPETPCNVESVAAVRDKAAENLDKMRGAMDYFEKIKPPRCLRSEHKAMLCSLEREREFLDAAERMFMSADDSELMTNTSAAAAYTGFEKSSISFTNTLDAFMNKMDKLRFIWI